MKERVPKTRERARPASTVILVREGDEGLQVYLLRRNPNSAFFPGNYVFPGGAVDRDDGQVDFWGSHVDMDRAGIFEHFGKGLPLEDALTFGVAAIRETFEEAGVFLAREKDAGTKDYDTLCELREGGGLGRGWMKERVMAAGWTLALSNLVPWAHWVTPEGMPKRFDTRFFLAFMPPGQQCIPDAEETTEGVWITPRTGMEKNAVGSIPLSPPTLVTLHELSQYPHLRSLLKAAEARTWGDPRLPMFYRRPEGAVILEPWDPFYGEPPEVEDRDLLESVLPPGVPFSRLWLHKGTWLPIRS